MLVLSLGGGNEAARVHQLIAGSAASWPLSARAQHERVRRIGSLVGIADDAIMQPRLAASCKRCSN
jgi:hypothetical protein